MINPDGKVGKANKINREYYQIGRVMADPFDRKSKGKKESLYANIDRMDQDADFSKRKYREIQTKKMENSRDRKWAKLKRNRIKKRVMKHN